MHALLPSCHPGAEQRAPWQQCSPPGGGSELHLLRVRGEDAGGQEGEGAGRGGCWVQGRWVRGCWVWGTLGMGGAGCRGTGFGGAGFGSAGCRGAGCGGAGRGGRWVRGRWAWGALGAGALGPSWASSPSIGAGAGLAGRAVGARAQVPPAQCGSVRAVSFNFLLNSLEGCWLMAHVSEGHCDTWPVDCGVCVPNRPRSDLPSPYTWPLYPFLRPHPPKVSSSSTESVDPHVFLKNRQKREPTHCCWWRS